MGSYMGLFSAAYKLLMIKKKLNLRAERHAFSRTLLPKLSQRFLTMLLLYLYSFSCKRFLPL